MRIGTNATNEMIWEGTGQASILPHIATTLRLLFTMKMLDDNPRPKKERRGLVVNHEKDMKSFNEKLYD